MTATTNGRVRFAVQEIRTVDEIDWLCGVSQLQPDELATAPYILETNERTAIAIHDQIGVHKQSDNYSESTTRLVAVIVGSAGPSDLYRVGSAGEWLHDRTLDFPILYIEVAGSKALVSERMRFDDSVLMYEPQDVGPRREERPWWRFW